jgi:hypothetical protein
MFFTHFGNSFVNAALLVSAKCELKPFSTARAQKPDSPLSKMPSSMVNIEIRISVKSAGSRWVLWADPQAQDWRTGRQTLK